MQSKTNSAEPEKTCFVISPIGDEGSEIRKNSNDVFKHIIAPAAEANGLVAVRSDMFSTPGIITSQIIRHILNDRMVIADLTNQNANVFYELALRHAFRKPVVQVIEADQRIPFDVQSTRVVKYRLDLDSVAKAREQISLQIESSLLPQFEVESPLTIVAKIDELTRSTMPETQVIMQTLSDQIENMNKDLSEIRRSICKPDDLKDAIPPLIKDRLEDTLRSYAEEIELLKSVRYAGVMGIFKRREMGIKAFTRAIDEEASIISVVGSSLKGLLQKKEYKDIAGKLKFKSERGLVQVRFLLTHPIFADFRASQESRGYKEIGLEIIETLKILKGWSNEYCEVKLYLGTPTCFAIKTSRQMLVNPYPYISVSYESPCFIVEHSPDPGTDRPCYFFDEFNSRHFGAWDTNLSIEVKDFDKTIDNCQRMLDDYAKKVEDIISLGKTLG